MSLLLMALLFLTSTTVAATSLEIIPAWDGHYRPDRQTEVGVRVQAREGGIVSVLLATKGQEITLSTQQTAGTTHTFWVPIRVTADTPLTARLLSPSPDRAAQARQGFHSPLPPVQILALAIGETTQDTPATQPPPGVFAFRPAIDSLPRTGQAYDTIDVLLVDTSALARLDRRQLQALSGYLARCGKLLAVDMTAPVLAHLRLAAACQGRFLASYPDIDTAMAGLASLLARQPSPMPSASALRQLANGNPSARTTRTALIGLFVVYFLILVLAGTMSGRAAPILGVSATVTLLVLLAGWSGGPRLSIYSWVELDAGDTRARYTALLGSEGSGLDDAHLSLPAHLGMPRPVPPLRDFHQRLENTDQGTQLHLDTPTRLFSRSEFYLAGSIAVNAPLSLRITDGLPVITNPTHHATSGEGFLLWQGHWFPLPPLPPLGRWQPTDNSPLVTPPLPEALWIDNRWTTRLFLPWLPAELTGNGRTQRVGWLSITASGEGHLP